MVFQFTRFDVWSPSGVYFWQLNFLYRKERKVFEEAQRVAREHLTKREREEVENLKARISELESQLKVKETRWKSATDRLKETVDAQKKEIQELKTANQQLERLRIEQLKKQTRATSGNSSGSSANNSLKKNTKPVSFKWFHYCIFSTYLWTWDAYFLITSENFNFTMYL